jgi:hypothetical protein
MNFTVVLAPPIASLFADRLVSTSVAAQRV